MKKLFFVFLFLPISIWLGMPANAKAATTAEIQAQIQALMAQITQLQAQLSQLQGNNGVGWCHSFSKNINRGETTYAGGSDIEVSSLEAALVKEGLIAQHSGDSVSYDDKMASAVSAFQEKYASEILTPSGLKKGTGFAGPSTRKKLNSLYGCKVACTTEAKQCSDGSYVSRTGPNCEFSKCPTDQCGADSDCPQVTCMALNCPVFKCVNGKCASSTPATTCTDSDGGKNYSVRGSLGGICKNNAPCGMWADSCQDSNNLIEYFCDGTNYNTNFELYKCPNGCLNGVCK